MGMYYCLYAFPFAVAREQQYSSTSNSNDNSLYFNCVKMSRICIQLPAALRQGAAALAHPWLNATWLSLT